MYIKTTNNWRKSLIAAAIASCLCAPVAFAQGKTTGSIEGNVLIESGNSLANVEVLLKHNTKGIVKRTTTNSQGEFSLKGLPIGTYTVTFSKDGFQTQSESRLMISAGLTSTVDVSMYSNDIERIEVNGAAIRVINMESSTTQLSITDEELAKLPVAQDLSSVALLSPAASLAADPAGEYGRGVSFSGSSVAENGFFLNGLNITDIRKGLGHISFPWEAVAQTNIVTGGVPAEFGNFIGGVTDVVTKSGDNEFKFGARFDYNPGSFLRSRSPDVWLYDTGHPDTDADGNVTGYPFTLSTYNGEDYTKNARYNIWASGPIIEDTLFFYALYNPQKVTHRWADTTSITQRENEADFWLANIDWYINENHSLTFTAMNNERENSDYHADYDFHPSNRDKSRQSGEFGEPTQSESGGQLFSVNYNGYITDDLSVSAVYGVTEQDSLEINPVAHLSRVWDSRSGSWQRRGDWQGWSSGAKSEDTRKQFRVDFDWVLDDHTISFGYSHENIETFDRSEYSGDGWRYDIYTATESRIANINAIIERNAARQGVDYVPSPLQVGDSYFWTKEYKKNGTTEQNYRSFYIEDNWQVTDQLTLNIGLRNSAFDAATGTGEEYVSMDNQWAPRLGINYDLLGDGGTKIFANYGRYYMPISPNTSARMTLPEVNITAYGLMDGTFNEENNTPNRVGELFAMEVNSDGELAQPVSTFVDKDLEPMYSDEYVLGIEHELNDEWVVGARYIYRDLKSSIEDTNLRFALVEKWGRENPEQLEVLQNLGLNTNVSWLALVINPGNPVKLAYDINQDGKVSGDEYVEWDADYLGLPKAKRKYHALELTANGQISDNFKLQASYTWSKSEGNTEGLVSGTHSQADPGWSGSYDAPELTDNSYGRTSNDIPHKIKVFGTYDINDAFSVGFNMQIQQGRPINKLGYHPQGVGSCSEPMWLDDEHTQFNPNAVTDCTDIRGTDFYYNGEDSPRGSHGHNKWIYNLDLSASYSTEVIGGNLFVSATIFNVFDFDTPTSYNDIAELQQGVDNPNYRSPVQFQAPRSAQLTVRYEF
ncbi:TonB-dependent receptor [Thalassotalea marina]|uniref:Membrane protein n=1 Tax=Thalassotalea marina TaxID=1673741 RepID=A0A919BJP7_9GAMM|nr:TonB-dependent receptor [Thalassotalea marina]GHF96076.1 membrane protein [Thalassotalea marina]